MKNLAYRKTGYLIMLSIVFQLSLHANFDEKQTNPQQQNPSEILQIKNISQFKNPTHQKNTVIFEENWSSGSFSTNNWTFEPSVGNWHINNFQGYPHPCAQFSWSPPKTNYSFSLISRNIDLGSNQNDKLLIFDLLYDEWLSTGDEYMNVYLYSQDTWFLVDSFSNNGDIPWTTYTYDITPHAQGETIKLRFEAQGAATVDIDFWRLDNIKVLEAEAILLPEITISSDSLFHYLPFAGAGGEWQVEVGNSGQAPLLFNIYVTYPLKNESFASNTGWIVLPEQINYNLHADSSISLSFGIQSQQLTHGIHHAAIVFESNDPDHSVISIPVTVDVGTLNFDETADISISIYSPPLSGRVYIIGNKKCDRITFRNLLGQVVYEVSPANGSVDFDISNLKTGVYLVELSIENGKKLGRKIAVTNN